MNNLNNAVFALATGLLAVGLASSSATAQMSRSASGFTPGAPFVVTIENSRGTPLMVVHAGRIPLRSDRRVRILLPDLGDGSQELVYVLSIQGDASLESDMNKRSQETAGRIHKVVLGSPVGPKLGKQGGQKGGQQSGSMLSIGAEGMHHTLGYDLSGDIVREQQDDWGAQQVPDAGSLGQAGDGVLSGGGAGSNNVSTSAGTGGQAP